MTPARHLPSPEARRRFGDRVDRLGTLYFEADPLADAACAALKGMSAEEREALISQAHLGAPEGAHPAVKALFEQVSHVPFWVDFERAERGGRALIGRGPLSGYVLALGSLVRSFCSPSGNKPLVASGQLEAYTVRRAVQTGRFVQQVCAPGGMRPGGAGFAATVRVRLLHAQVRTSLLASERWRSDLHGLPISQPDMAATLLLFSSYLAEGLRRIGAPLSPSETEDLLHLWRYVGWVIGVREELLCASVEDAREYRALLELTEGFPDDDSRLLARALIENIFGAGPNGMHVGGLGSAPWYALSTFLIGEELAQHLGFPETPWRLVVPALRSILRPASGVLWGLPGLERFSNDLGRVYWERAIA